MKFIYPNANLLGAAVEDGDYAANTFSSSSVIANETRINDMSTGSTVGDWYSDEVIRLDLGSSPGNIDTIAIHSNEVDNNDITLYASDSPDDMATSYATFTEFVEGWQEETVDPTDDKQYWFLKASAGLFGITEVILGVTYTFDYARNLNNTEKLIYPVDRVQSYAGQEYATKRGAGHTEWNWEWNFVTASMKTSLENMRDELSGDYRKFLFFDDTNYHYVRMEGLEFEEVANNMYSTSIKLIEQI